MSGHTLLLLPLLVLITPDTYARSLCAVSRQSRGQNQRQDQGVVGILTPESVVGVGVVEPYLPNFGFWADVGGLVLGQNPAVSPFVRLSRDIFESQECAEFVSCEMSRISKRHSPIQFIHTFLEDFPFDGDLAKRLKMGSTMARGEERCGSGFKCNPMEYLNKGVKTLGLLHDVMKAVK